MGGVGCADVCVLGDQVAAAYEHVQELVSDVVVGDTYTATVTDVKDFGELEAHIMSMMASVRRERVKVTAR
jgi:polyribonucleotide nucleotidyltransferase